MPKRKKSGAGEYVGYGHPPRSTQFKSGKSGNPRGRPKGSRGINSILQSALHRKVTVTEGGKQRRLSALEAMLLRLRNDALRGDQRAIKLVLGFFDRYSNTPETDARLQDLLAGDEQILREYLKDPPGITVDDGVQDDT